MRSLDRILWQFVAGGGFKGVDRLALRCAEIPRIYWAVRPAVEFQELLRGMIFGHLRIRCL